jgi:glycosyltransferase involved in cell wall biosynthesis
VDVILPTHGGERWVAEAIESVLAQTCPHWRLWVVDDASPDATAERVEALRRQHPHRIELVRLPARRRTAGARMAGAALGDGVLLAFLDQDDRWHPRKLERQRARFERDPELGALHTDVQIIDAAGRVIRGAAAAENAQRAQTGWGCGAALGRELFRRNSIRLASAVIRRRAFEASGGFDAALFGGEDWEFWVRFAARFPIAHLAEPLLQRRLHAGNSSRRFAAERASGKLRALESLARSCEWLAPELEARRAELLERERRKRSAASDARQARRDCAPAARAWPRWSWGKVLRGE